MLTSSIEVDAWPTVLGASSRVELRTSSEDWTGKTKSAERRKLQNRLNQRAHRRRAYEKRGGILGIDDETSRDPKYQGDSTENSAAALAQSPSHSSTQITSRKPRCMGAAPRVQDIMRRFADHARMSYMQGKPVLSHLPLLTRYNVSIALQRNADLLGVAKEYAEYEGVSPFGDKVSLVQLDSITNATAWPPNMLPTQSQRSKPHHPWVDVFPWPQMRDNMLTAFDYANVCDEDEMCHEVVEYDGNDGSPLLLVWGDASNPQNWEIGMEFLEKWVWLLRGCEGLLEATNYWRAKRGEQPISQRKFSAAIERSMPPQLCGSEL